MGITMCDCMQHYNLTLTHVKLSPAQLLFRIDVMNFEDENEHKLYLYIICMFTEQTQLMFLFRNVKYVMLNI